MSWMVAGGAAAAAAAMLVGGGGWLLTRRRHARIDSAEEAASAAEATLSAFVAKGAVVGADGGGALAVDAGGRVAVMKRLGRRIAVREVAWAAVRSTAGGIVVETDERRFGAVALAGVDVLDIRRLAPRG